MDFWTRLQLPVNTFSLRHEIIKENLPLGRDDAVADVGVGTGYSAFNFAPGVRELVGIDVAAPVIDFLKSLPWGRGVEFVRADIADVNDAALKKLAGKFDRLYAADVLEHVSAPAAFFQNVASLLKEGGAALITFPNTPGHGVTRFRTKTELAQNLAAAGLKARTLDVLEPTTWLKIIYSAFVKLPLSAHRRVRRRPRGRGDRGEEQTFDQTYAFAFNRRLPWYRVLINFYFEALMAVAKMLPLYKTTPAPEEILGRRVLVVATE
ncbi:MAG: methyltransferase domain-containing protein [candidate division Zixibacteria bacterium]|nr:methyltransferase domain-containing protein [candidate division Zixibacteria bacterium]